MHFTKRPAAAGLQPAVAVYQLDVASLRTVRHTASGTRIMSRVAPTVWLLGVVSFLTDISSEMVASIMPAYLLITLQLSPAQFGMVDGLYQGVSAVTRLLSGVAADRWRHHKLVATIGYGLSAATRIGFLAAGSAWVGLASMVSLDRIGKGIRTAPRDAMISLSARDTNLAATFGVHRALDAAGVVVGPLAAFLILSTVPGRFVVIFIVSFLVAVLGVGVLVLLVQPPSDRSGERMGRASIMSAARLLFERRFALVAGVGLLLSVTLMSDAFLYVMLQRAGQFSPAVIPLFYTGTSTVFLLTAVPAGRAADRIGKGRVFVVGHAAVLLVYLALVTLPFGTPLLLACLVLHGLYYAATDGVLAALASQVLPADQRASGLALIATGTSLGKLASSMIFGVIWSWHGPQGMVVVAAFATAVAMAWALTQLRRLDGHPPAVSRAGEA